VSELRKKILNETRRVVMKFGSRVLVDSEAGGIREKSIRRIVGSVSKLHQAGQQVVIVSSGAVGAGMSILGYSEKPRRLDEKQACAAVGQIKLMHTWKSAFMRKGIHAAQILLSAEDFRDRARYKNIQNTVQALLRKGVIPIINENDTVAVQEIKVGDNDKLSADVTHFLNADLLMLFTDEDGLYDSNPKKNPDARLLHLVPEITDDVMKLAGKKGEGGSLISTGGMYSKLEAVREVTRAGGNAVLANGMSVLPHQILSGKLLGTLFLGQPKKISSRGKWLRFVSTPSGVITVDAGGARALAERNSSLLAVGITGVSGVFNRKALVEVVDAEKRRIARGITNFSSQDIDDLQGKSSAEIRKISGGRLAEEVIHRNNMVLL